MIHRLIYIVSSKWAVIFISIFPCKWWVLHLQLISRVSPCLLLSVYLWWSICGSLYLSFFEFIKLFIYADFFARNVLKSFQPYSFKYFFLLTLSADLWYSYCVYVVHSAVVQSLSHAPLFATPWTAGCQASLSFTTSQSLQNSCPSAVSHISLNLYLSLCILISLCSSDCIISMELSLSSLNFSSIRCLIFLQTQWRLLPDVFSGSLLQISQPPIYPESLLIWEFPFPIAFYLNLQLLLSILSPEILYIPL